MLAVSMLATVSPSEIGRKPVAPGSGFWFDPAYAAFLESVREHTPADATIAIVVPPTPDVYVYEAAYQLAPRRVVVAGSYQEGEAGFIAAYRYQYRPGQPDVIQIPHGALFRRR